MMVRERVWAATLAAAVLMSCEKSPFEPRGEGERIPIGIVIEGQTRPDSVSRFTFTGSPNQPYLVFLEALEGRVQLSVYDSTSGYPGYPAATASAVAGGPWLEQNPSNTFGTPSGAVYLVFVWATPAGTTARFRFKVHPIETRPERVPNSFSFGDTVSGETIDPMFDLDWFSAHGVEGQEIVTVVEPQEPVGSGSVGLSVIDQAENQFLGSVFADAGTPTPLTTGRIRLPGTRAYRFAFGSVISNTYPRYRGPYRFWTYVIDRAPEHRPAAIQFDTEISNEAIDRAGDLDEFTFVANAGTDFKAFIQAPWIVQLEVVGSTGAPLAVASSQASDTGLLARGTSRFHIVTPGTYTLRLAGAAPSFQSDTGRYRILLHAVDRAPEHVPSAIAPGDTIATEVIDLPGDIDEFTFSGVAGAEYNVFVEPQNALPDSRLQLDVIDGAGTVLRTIERFGSDTGLLEGVTGRFALPSTGVYRLRVSGVDGFGMTFYRGAYRLSLYQVDRRPESNPAALAFGDSVSGEAIDLPGDVDEFTVTISDSSGGNLAVAVESTSVGGGVIAQLINAANGQVIATASSPLLPQRGSAGTLRLGPGSYIVRVWTSAYEYDQSRFRGRYRVWLYRFGFGPEVARDTFAIGDTVSGEVLEPWGDIDEFHFYGVRGQHVNIMAQGLGQTSTAWFEFSVIPPLGSRAYMLFMNASTSGAALEDLQTRRVDLPGTGWYTVAVVGGSGSFEARGAYRFTVLPIDPGPEHVGATLNPGDSVTAEPIDEPGDWDEFTLVGLPGETMSILFDGDVYTGLSLVVQDPATGDTLAWQPHQFRRIVGPFQIPASGQAQIFVAQYAGFTRFCYSSTCNVFSYAGPYRFRVLAVNRAPEFAPAAIAVGDTVRGETISPLGDIDEFTATGTPGEQVTLLSRLTTFSAADSAIVVEAFDPATGMEVGGNSATWGDTFWTVGTFTVPSSGTFRVRARVYGEWGYGVGLSSYEFALKRGP